LNEWDQTLCIRINRASRNRIMRNVFCAISHLGDGVFWYALMLALLLAFHSEAVPAVIHMIFTGLLCTTLYKLLKHKTSRPRPYQIHKDVICLAAPLDQFSFPSGHMLHAVAFSVVAVAYFPMLAWLLLPFTLLVAASRVILGLHYPSDVLAGALLGLGIAQAGLAVA
jgi:undecaprenyl-diphosphatase